MRTLLAVDIGSTSIKALVFDLSGAIVAGAKSALPYIRDDSGVTYHADALWKSAAGAIQRAIGAAGADSIAAVAVTGFGNDGVPLDATGNELFPFISWQCGRTVPVFEEFTASMSCEQLFLHTGVQARHIDTMYRMLWLRKHRPQAYEKMNAWLMVEDYINYRLCGEIVTDHTVAFTTGLYDPQTERYSQAVAGAAGIDTSLLPKVSQSGTLIGSVTAGASEQTGLRAGTPVVLGGWDIQCSALAVGAFADSTLMDVMGTWETLLMTSGTYRRDKSIYEMGINACHHVAKGRYAYPVYFVSAAAVEWFIESCYEKDAQGLTSDALYEKFVAEAAGAPLGAGGAMFLPNLFGAMVPVSDARSRGAFAGLSAATKRPHMARALLEGLGFMCKQVLDCFERIEGEPLRQVMVCGGGARNALWRSVKADIAGKRMLLPRAEETTAMGAAVLAGVGAGLYQDEKQAVASMLRVDETIEPQFENSQRYAKIFTLYAQLYPQLKELHHSLSLLNEQAE